MQLVVRNLSLFFSHYQCLTPTSCFLDSPEQAPGAKLGTSKHSNTDAIIGGAVSAVVIISLLAIAIGFFLRRRRRNAPSSVAPPVVGASQPPVDETQQPLTMAGGHSASSIPGTIGSLSTPETPVVPMMNVRVSCSTCAHCMRFLTHPFFFLIQDPNYLTTLPGYQGVPQTPATPSQGTALSHNGTGNSLATLQTSRQQGYHGFPTV